MDDVLIVGGGIGGLTVARDLVRGGRDVVVLEASDAFGGQVSRQRVGGIEVDAAAESFATRGGTVADLATELGLGNALVSPREDPAWLFRADGTAVPLPATSILGIPGVPMARDVLDAIGTRAALRAQLDLLIPDRVGANATSLGQLVRTRMGEAVLDGLVAPVVRGVHSAHPDDVPIDRAHPGLRAAFLADGSLQHAVRGLRGNAPAGSQVAGIRGGVVRIVDELLADLDTDRADLRTAARVVEADADGIRLESGERLRGRVVLAAPGVSGPTERRRITVVTLVVDAPDLDSAPRGTGVLVAEGAPVTARALTHATAKWAWLADAAAGRHVLRLSYDAPPSDPVDAARRDAELLLGARIPRVEDGAVTEWTRPAGPVHAVDGMDAVGEAGTSTGLAAVVASAREAAGRILASATLDRPSS